MLTSNNMHNVDEIESIRDYPIKRKENEDKIFSFLTRSYLTLIFIVVG